ncbi:MAG: exosortase [Planctomycetes bacterium]|nr:exosortase [Planctomycetota bacterium]
METAKEMISRNRLHGLEVRAVVLVGGRDFGRCPLAAHLPTALWPTANKPVLVHLLDHLAKAGFRQAAVCCAEHDAAAVEAVCREAALKVGLVVEELTAGTAGCLRDAVGSDPGDLILVLSAGMLAPPALEDLIEAHQAGGADLTMVFNPGPDRGGSSGGPAEIYLCRPGVLPHIPRAGYCDIKEGLIPSLLRAGGIIHPVVLDRDVGNFHNRAGYLGALEVLFSRETPESRSALSCQRSPEAPVVTGAEAVIHPTARICGPALIGDYARLAEGVVVVGPALIGPRVAVGAESLVVRSAVWAEAQVGVRCEVRDSIVDCRAVLPDGAQVVEKAASPGLSDRGSLVGRWAARLPELTPRSARPLAYAAGGIIVLAAFLWSYWPTFTNLVAVWRRSDEYSSGLLVPFLAAYVLWLRRQDLRLTPVQPALLLGLGAFLFAQAVRAMGLDFYSSAERLSVILSVAALVLMMLGWKYLAKVAPVLLFLCLMLPWPNRVQNALTLPLQRWSTTSAVFCLELVGYEVRQDGNVIHMGDASVAVAEACNGLRMIMAFFVISGLVALLVKRAWWEKLVILVSSLPIAFLCNTLRLATTALFFTFVREEKWEQWFHDWGGYAMMPLALALVVGELWLLTRLTTPPLLREPAIISRRHTPHISGP